MVRVCVTATAAYFARKRPSPSVVDPAMNPSIASRVISGNTTSSPAHATISATMPKRWG